jgi:hypothetical protein
MWEMGVGGGWNEKSSEGDFVSEPLCTYNKIRGWFLNGGR